MNNNMTSFLWAIILTIFGAILGYGVHWFTTSQPLPKESGKDLSFWPKIPIWRRIAFALSVSIILNAFMSGIFEIIVQATIGAGHDNRAQIGYLINSVQAGMAWAVIHFILWGTAGSFIIMIAKKNAVLDPLIFLTTGFIAGVFLTPLGSAAWFISHFAMGNAPVSTVYELCVPALARLCVPSMLYASGIGASIAYICSNVAIPNELAIIYHARYRIAAIGAYLAVIGLAINNTFAPGTIVWQAFAQYHVGIVIFCYLLFWFSGFLAGTEIYTKILEPRWIVSNELIKTTASSDTPLSSEPGKHAS